MCRVHWKATKMKGGEQRQRAQWNTGCQSKIGESALLDILLRGLYTQVSLAVLLKYNNKQHGQQRPPKREVEYLAQLHLLHTKLPG